MTESQADEMIELLKEILHKIEMMSMDVTTIDGNVSSIDSAVSSIDGHASMIETNTM